MNTLIFLRFESIDNESVVSALQFTGMHRTETERADRNVMGLFTIGGSLKTIMKTGTIAINTVFNQFDGRIEPRDEPYNFYVFKGKHLLNFSADYKKTYKNIHAFGETAMSDNGGLATVNGVIMGLDRRISLAAQHRHYSRDYQVLQGAGFGEYTGTNNDRDPVLLNVGSSSPNAVRIEQVP